MLFPIYLILHDAIIGGSYVIHAYDLKLIMLMHILKFNFFIFLMSFKIRGIVMLLITRDH